MYCPYSYNLNMNDVKENMETREKITISPAFHSYILVMSIICFLMLFASAAHAIVAIMFYFVALGLFYWRTNQMKAQDASCEKINNPCAYKALEFWEHEREHYPDRKYTEFRKFQEEYYTMLSRLKSDIQFKRVTEEEAKYIFRPYVNEMETFVKPYSSTGNNYCGDPYKLPVTLLYEMRIQPYDTTCNKEKTAMFLKMMKYLFDVDDYEQYKDDAEAYVRAAGRAIKGRQIVNQRGEAV